MASKDTILCTIAEELVQDIISAEGRDAHERYTKRIAIKDELINVIRNLADMVVAAESYSELIENHLAKKSAYNISNEHSTNGAI